MKTEIEIKEICKNYCVNLFEATSWSCYGAGEIGAEVYFYNPLTKEKEYCYHLSGDNGCNTFYNPGGEPWTDEQNPEKEKGIVNDFIESLSLSDLYSLYSVALMRNICYS